MYLCASLGRLIYSPDECLSLFRVFRCYGGPLTAPQGGVEVLYLIVVAEAPVIPDALPVIDIFILGRLRLLFFAAIISDTGGIFYNIDPSLFAVYFDPRIRVVRVIIY